jgi:hypothetical protein
VQVNSLFRGAGNSIKPFTSAAVQYWSMGRQRYYRPLARYCGALRVSGGRAARRGSHTRAKPRLLDAFRPRSRGKAMFPERPTLCWSKADSNSGSHPRATPPAATRFVADSALEEKGFEFSVPSERGSGRAAPGQLRWSPEHCPGAFGTSGTTHRTRWDRQFESPLLQRCVACEPEFLDQLPSQVDRVPARKRIARLVRPPWKYRDLAV